MQKHTILQVIDDAKSGTLLDPVVCRDTILALSSMLAKSRMTLEIIADKAGSPEQLFYAANLFLRDTETLRQERTNWMNATPRLWLIDQAQIEKEKADFINSK